MTPSTSRDVRKSGAFQPLVAAGNRIAGPALLFVLMVFGFWRILLTDQYTWLNGYDITSQVLPWLQFQAAEWHAGRFPLWSPYEWAGQNLLGQGQPGVVNPLNWVLFAAPLRRGWLRQGVLHWWFFLLHFVGALNLYFLAKELGAGRLPAVFGGLCFGLLAFLGSNDWPQMLSGVIWAPLVYLFVLRSTREERPWRPAAWAGVFWGLSWLSGHHQLPIFASLGLVVLAVGLRARWAVLSAVIGGLIAAPQLLPGLAYGKIAVRWVGMENPVGWKDKVAYFIHEQYATTPQTLFSIVLPGAETHTSMFIGATALVLALWAIRTQWARIEVRCLLGVALAAVFYSMARMGGLEPLLYSLAPMIEKARSPSMAVAIFGLAMAALAAIGLEVLRHKPLDASFERLHWWFGGGVIGLFLLAKVAPAQGSQLEARWMTVAFVSVLVGWAYRATRLGHLRVQTLTMVLVGALLVEAANMSYFNMANRHDTHAENMLKPMSKHMDVRDYLSTRPAPVRITVDDQVIPFNFGDWHGVEVMGGYLASLTKMHQEVDWFSQRGLQLMGVGYHVGPTPRVEGSQLLFQGADGVNVWQYPREPLPRVWLAPGAMQYRTTAELQQWIENESFDLKQMVLSQEAVTGLGGCPAGEASLLRHDSGRVAIGTHSACAAVLVLADSDDPGWSVTVDGQAAKRLNAFHALRAVVVPAGDHKVEWTYWPQGLSLGLAAAVAGLLLVAAALFLPARYLAKPVARGLLTEDQLARNGN